MIDQTTPGNPLAFLQGQPEQPVKGKQRDQMGQSDFIQLMIAQMKNQDPTKPLDPNDFMSQLAQFSTVNGIAELKKSVDSMVSMLATDQSVKAATLVGHEVMAPGNVAWLPPGGKVAGQVVLDSSTTDLNIQVYAPNGTLVRTIPMGMHAAGAVPFTWDGFREDGKVAPMGSYRIVAEAVQNDKTVQVPVQTRTRVQSVDLKGQGGNLTLNLDNGQSVPLRDIDQIL
jgi:flagellar basal-body rod modification protein FlgD